MICKECKTEKPILNQKRELCYSCYYRLRKQNPNEFKPKYLNRYKTNRSSRPTIEEKTSNNRAYYKREMLFIQNCLQNRRWLYQPVTFHCKNYNYTPDFYLLDENIFIEVIGSTQAYYSNLHKYRHIKQCFPYINFEFRLQDGTEIGINKDKNGICRKMQFLKNS